MATRKPGKKPTKKSTGKSTGKSRTTAAGGFTIKCNADGLIVGASGSNGDVSGFIEKIGDIKLEKTDDGVCVTTIEFQQDEEFGSCTWRQIGGAWRCI